ncbi:hypothetical protein [Blastococcus sp. SYSU DS0973]
MITGPGATAGVSTWQGAGWRAAALDWAGEQLAATGRQLGGAPEQPHVRSFA